MPRRRGKRPPSPSPALRAEIVIPGPHMIPHNVGIVMLVSERTAIELGLRAGEMRSVSLISHAGPGEPGASLSGALMFTKECGDA